MSNTKNFITNYTRREAIEFLVTLQIEALENNYSQKTDKEIIKEFESEHGEKIKIIE